MMICHYPTVFNICRLKIVEWSRNPVSWRYRVSNFPKTGSSIATVLSGHDMMIYRYPRVLSGRDKMIYRYPRVLSGHDMMIYRYPRVL